MGIHSENMVRTLEIKVVNLNEKKVKFTIQNLENCVLFLHRHKLIHFTSLIWKKIMLYENKIFRLFQVCFLLLIQVT